MRAYSGAMSNTETARPTSTRLSQLPITEDVAEMFRCAMRCRELEGVFWERRYRGDDLM